MTAEAAPIPVQLRHNHTLPTDRDGLVPCGCGVQLLALPRPCDEAAVFECPNCKSWHSLLWK